MKVSRYIQGYSDGKKDIIAKLKVFIDNESQFIPSHSFDCLLDRLSQIILNEEKDLIGKIQNETSPK